MTPTPASAPVTVYLDEEYGYRYWIWETGMSQKELIAWWTGLETVYPFFGNPGKTLPGKLTQVDWEDDALVSVEPVEGFVPVPYEQFAAGWNMHLHCDDDSILRFDGEEWNHKGFRL